jgi:hypothetical protein
MTRTHDPAVLGLLEQRGPWAHNAATTQLGVPTRHPLFAPAATRSVLLLLLVVGPEQKPERPPGQALTWPLVRESRRLPAVVLLAHRKQQWATAVDRWIPRVPRVGSPRFSGFDELISTSSRVPVPVLWCVERIERSARRGCGSMPGTEVKLSGPWRDAD